MDRLLQELVLSTADYEKMLKSITDCLPEEGCGLLAGAGNLVQVVIPMENIEHSPVRYRMSPQDQLNAFIHIEERGWDLLGIYHSHPNGPNTPSETDITEAFYPDSVYVIISRQSGEWTMRGFYLLDKQVKEIEIKAFE